MDQPAAAAPLKIVDAAQSRALQALATLAERVASGQVVLLCAVDISVSDQGATMISLTDAPEPAQLLRAVGSLESMKARVLRVIAMLEDAQTQQGRAPAAKA